MIFIFLMVVDYFKLNSLYIKNKPYERFFLFDSVQYEMNDYN